MHFVTCYTDEQIVLFILFDFFRMNQIVLSVKLKSQILQKRDVLELSHLNLNYYRHWALVRLEK